MGKPVASEIVVVPFPISDLSQTNRRPALVLVGLDGEDLILCMITSREVRVRYAISLDTEDFERGSLPVASNIRPSRLFTADAGIVTSIAGKIDSAKFAVVTQTVKAIFE